MSASSDIYLDNGGTTSLDERVRSGLALRLGWPLGNPNAAHAAGAAARRMLEDARATLARALGGSPDGVVFTSGGTESIHLGMRGGAWTTPGRVAITAVEHSATRTAAEALVAQGWTLDVIPVTSTGRVEPSALEAGLRSDTRVVALMLAQNEVGTVTDVAALAPIVRRLSPRARLVVDAVQAFTRVPFRVDTLGADCVVVTAHKIHGPLGIGALWSRAPVHPLVKGGGQERGQRGGTQPAVLAWGLGEAAQAALDDTHAQVRMAALRDLLLERLLESLTDATLTGEPSGPRRTCNNLHLCIPGLPSEPLVNALSEAGVHVSAGAACSTGKGRVSPTLQALGRSAAEGAFLRLTVGRFTTEAEVLEAASRIVRCVHTLRRAYAT